MIGLIWETRMLSLRTNCFKRLHWLKQQLRSCQIFSLTGKWYVHIWSRLTHACRGRMLIVILWLPPVAGWWVTDLWGADIGSSQEHNLCHQCFGEVFSGPERTGGPGQVELQASVWKQPVVWRFSFCCKLTNLCCKLTNLTSDLKV